MLDCYQAKFQLSNLFGSRKTSLILLAQLCLPVHQVQLPMASYESDNLQYDTLVFWVLGTNDSSTKTRVSDVSCKILCKYRFNYSFIFLYKFTEIKINFLSNYKKEIMLGTSDAWSFSRSSYRPSVLYRNF